MVKSFWEGSHRALENLREEPLDLQRALVRSERGRGLAVCLAAALALVLTACGGGNVASPNSSGVGGASTTASTISRTVATAPATVPVTGATTPGGAPAELVGDWLGPWPGAAAGCSPEYVEYFIYATGSYSDTWNSEYPGTVAPPQGTTTTAPQYGSGCGGGATAYGTYSVEGDLLTFHQQQVPTCPVCTQQQDIPVTFSFVDGALQLCDYPSGGCWTYDRQQGAATRSAPSRLGRPEVLPSAAPPLGA